MNRDRIGLRDVRQSGARKGRLGMAVAGAVGLALAGGALMGCAATRTHESTGEYVDNSVVTARVKSALLGDPALKSMQISVKTYKDVVQLSGFVDSRQASQRAGEVARAVEGVSSVRNDLIVK